MSVPSPSPDAHVILLLCSRLGLPERAGVEPFTASEWAAVARALRGAGQAPAALLSNGDALLDRVVAGDVSRAQRARALLRRSVQLGVELERLAARGIWALTRADSAYPRRLKERLGNRRPPVLFGVGPAELLDKAGVAVVGSRDASESEIEAAADLGRACARSGATVFSGAARGVDLTAMLACSGAGGATVGVLADSLERTIRRRELREPVLAGRLALVTPYHPAAPFTVGTAMGRNKYIYCLAEYAVVVAAKEPRGGTWTGAQENLRAGWVPLFVWEGTAKTPAGAALLEGGARRLGWSDTTGENLLDRFARTMGTSPAGYPVSEEERNVGGAARDEEAEVELDDSSRLAALARPVVLAAIQTPATAGQVAKGLKLTKTLATRWLEAASSQGQASATGTKTERTYMSTATPALMVIASGADHLFDAIREVVGPLMESGATEDEIADRLKVCKADAKAWLQAHRRSHPTQPDGTGRKARCQSRPDTPQLPLPIAP